MEPESLPTQRSLVDLPLHLSDRRLWIQHAFPFVDRHWRISFYLLDVAGDWPRVLRERLRLEPGGLFSQGSAASLAPIGSVPFDELAELVHFDPWWVLRQVVPKVTPEARAYLGWGASPDAAWVEAYQDTNIAVEFVHEGKSYGVTDLAFDRSLRALQEVRTRALARTRAFRFGEIELLALRRPPRYRSAPAFR